jgi:hypothetical protein
MYKTARSFRLAGSVVLLLLPAMVFAQHPDDFERVLLPVLTGPTAGAHGSLWTTEVWVHNSGEVPVPMLYQECWVSACALYFHVPPSTTQRPPIGTLGPDERPGMLLWIPKEHSSAISFSLRAQDLSRQSQTWGTEIPVVREAEFLTSTAQLLNVPITDEFRQTLRIYEVESRSHAEFIVRVYEQESNLLLGERTLLTRGFGDPDWGIPRRPGSVGAGLLDLFALPQSVTRVRVEVTPVTTGIRFWAFISVTNNETQHVTTITPQ